jgi:hypothetical protein
MERRMRLLNKEFILGCIVFIVLYVAVAHIAAYGLLPEFLKTFQYRLGPDFFLVIAPVLIITGVMGIGCALFILHQFITEVGMLILDTLSHFKRK